MGTEFSTLVALTFEAEVFVVAVESCSVQYRTFPGISDTASPWRAAQPPLWTTKYPWEADCPG